MSKSILTIEFVVEEQGTRIETTANKGLSKSDIVFMVEEYLNKLREAIKNEAN